MEFFSYSTEILLFLFIVAVIAAYIDTLAGSGGLLALPALILCGVPPLAALGTNKLQGSVGTATASIMMLKHKQVKWHQVKWLMLAAFIGSALGTLSVQLIHTQALEAAIPIALCVILAYFLLSPTLERIGLNQLNISKRLYKMLVIPIIGFYDGMFGPGTGSFFTLAGTALQNKGVIEATAIAKTLNFATNISSLIVFIMLAQVIWPIGIAMMLGQLIGAWLGSRALMTIKPEILRLIIVILCSGMLVKYAFF